MKNQNLTKAAIRVHVEAEGPVLFQSIHDFVKQQVDHQAQDYEVVEELNVLLRHGIVRLYEDGTSFV